MSNGFFNTLAALQADPRIQLLKQFPQHRNSTTYNHCVHVALCSYRLAQKLHWRVDGAALARGAMLHDYYLYSTRQKAISAYRHGTGHPAVALQNAEKTFPLTDKEKAMILCHMWPLTLRRLPRSKEGWAICFADKYCALREAMQPAYAQEA